VSERRKPSLILHVALASGEKLYADLFDAADFPGKVGSVPGLFRMRVRTKGRKSAWYCPAGRKYAFLSFGQAADALLSMATGEAPVREEEPWLPEGSVILIPGGLGPIRTRSIPFRGENGLWSVFAGMSGSDPVLVSQITVREIAGFICREMPPKGVPCPTKAEALAKGWIKDGEYPRRREVTFTAADLRKGRPRKQGQANYGKRPEVKHVSQEPGA